MSAAAYFRTLRDIDDGHITLSVSVDRYDPMTGEPYPQPHIRTVCPDRAASGALPDSAGRWWEPMVAAGHLELTDTDRWGRTFYKVTDTGREFLADYKAGAQ